MDLQDGESAEVKGSGSRHYRLTNTGGVYSCSCPAWRNQGAPIDKRTCKHLKRYRGEDAEQERLGADFVPTRTKAASTQGPPLLLAEPWDNARDLSGWWMSEKLDGVRAYWDGKGFLSRRGNPFLAPDWFVDALPSDTPLDGELWIGRQQFQRTVSVVRRHDRGEAWRDVKYLVFDAPAFDGAFEARLEQVRTQLASTPEHLAPLDHDACAGLEHIQRRLAEVESQGGEGLMLRQPGSRYEVGRSDTLLKVKTFHDAEAIVTGYVAGKGRHKGTAGALKVELADGTAFSVGTGLSDAERRDPPAIGAVVTFRYQELSKAGVPRFPSFVRLREDVEWKGTRPPPTNKSAAKSTATAAPPANDSDGETRYFELRDGTTNKFWEVTVEGSSHRVRYGRIGAKGRSQTKDHPDAAAARVAADKLVDAKIAKGYVRIVASE